MMNPRWIVFALVGVAASYAFADDKCMEAAKKYARQDAAEQNDVSIETVSVVEAEFSTLRQGTLEYDILLSTGDRFFVGAAEDDCVHSYTIRTR